MGRQQLRVLLLEPFYGGSHRDVADNLVRHSTHRIELLTLPARFWKWRMRGAALWFAREISARLVAESSGAPAHASRGPCDLILCSGLMDIAALRALVGDKCPPILLYCHETQLAYPQPQASEADLHFAFTDLVNMLTADHVLFNSHSHRDRYLSALPGFLRRLPEYRPMWSVEEVEGKSTVCYPGITPVDHTTRSQSPGNVTELGDGRLVFPYLGTNTARPWRAMTGDAPISCVQRIWANAIPKLSDSSQFPPENARDGGAPLIIWNHRWEFDKNPTAFFAALREVKRQGHPFRLALLGENYKTVPPVFPAARSEFGPEIVQYGYVSDRAEYESWLDRGEIVVSTAIQENFGISVLEAVARGCHPLLPRRLSYPEIIPARFHGTTLYDDDDSLVALLVARLTTNAEGRGMKAQGAEPELVSHARSFSWTNRISEFDSTIAQWAERGNGQET